MNFICAAILGKPFLPFMPSYLCREDIGRLSALNAPAKWIHGATDYCPGLSPDRKTHHRHHFKITYILYRDRITHIR